MTDTLDALLNRFVKAGTVPGLCAGIIQNGRVIHQSAAGSADAAGQKPMTANTVMRVFSLTKPVVALAMLRLVQAGKLALDAPVGRYIASFRRQTVATPQGTVPAVHPVTVCHLLQMTSGIPTFHSDTSPEVRALAGEMEEAQAQGRPLTTMQAAERIGRLPLRFQPGEGFLYGMSMDVAGAVIEAVTGRTLAEYLDETVFTPFEMRDTAFYVKAPERLADIVRGEGGGFRRAPEPRYRQVPEPPAFACGGDGLYSTLHDILRFADRLSCAEGTADAATVRQMTSPPLKDLSAASFHEIPILRGKRYAMGCSVVTRPEDCAIAARAGEFGWYGHAGGWMMCLPSHKLSAVLLAQRLPSAHTELVPPFSEYIGRLLLE